MCSLTQITLESTHSSIDHIRPLYIWRLALPHLYFTQGIGQLSLFVSHLRSQDKSGKLILISISYTQLLVGSGSSFFSILFSKYKKWLNHNRLTSLWEFTDKIQLQLTIKREWIPTLPRERDIFLMDYFVRQQYKSSDLKLLNQCRLYLQVLSLTDICSADGANIVTPICNGLKLVDRRSTLHWPEQERPSKVAWNLWRVATEHLAGDSIHR